MAIRILSLLVFGLLLNSTPTYATQDIDYSVIGTIIEIEGAATIQYGEKTPEAAKPDMPIHLDDRLETGSESKMHILFIDDTELTLSEKALLTVDDYVFDPDEASENKGRFSITRGPFLFVSGLLGKREKPDIKINTTYGSIGLRGTTVWGGEIDNEYAVFVDNGEVSVETNRGRIRVGKGQGTTIRSRNAIPSRAKTWPTIKLERAKKVVAMKRRDHIKQRVAQRKESHKALYRHHKENIQNRKQNQRNDIQERRGNKRDNIQDRREEYRDKIKEQKNDMRQNRQNYREKQGSLERPAPRPVPQKRTENEREHQTGDPARQQENNEKHHLRSNSRQRGSR